MHALIIFKKLNTILSKHQKRQVLKLVILMIIGGVLEMCSVSLILPFMNIIMEPEKTMESGYIQSICNMLGIRSANTFLVVIAVVMAVIFLLKNIFFLYEYNVQYRTVYGNMLIMQEKLLSTLLHRPYEYFLKINSGEVVRIINTDTPNAFTLLVSLLQLFTEFIVSGMIILTVLLIAPVITLIMGAVLLVLVLFINHILKPILHRAGEGMQESSAGMNKWLLQSIQGIKDVKVTSKEGYFTKKFNDHGMGYVDALRKSNVLVIVPRFIIEAVSMCVIFAVIAIFIINGTRLEVIIPMLTAVAMASMRLLPSMSRISQFLGIISYNEPMLDKLIEYLKVVSGKEEVSLEMEIDTSAAASSGRITGFSNNIRLENITYSYPGTDTLVFDGADLTVDKGMSIGIIGASGAGKTTAVDLLLGMLDPDKGRVLLDDTDIQSDLPGFFDLVGYIPQSIFMMDDTIRANVAFGEEDVSDDAVWDALKDASLDEFVKGLPDGLDTEIGERGIRLSGGQKQRIGIARALYRDPEILIFDEATSALDDETEKSIMESINNLKGHKTMIIIAHRLTTIEDCDAIYRVEDGKIFIADDVR